MVLGIGLVIAVLLVTAWLALVIALAVWLFEASMSWPAVLGIAALLNVVIAAILAWVAKSRAVEMPFTATLRQLSSDSDATSGVGDA